jgi:hypothetical protein
MLLTSYLVSGQRYWQPIRLEDVFMERARMEPMSQGLLDLDAHPDYLSLPASLRYDVELRKVKLTQLFQVGVSYEHCPGV